MLTLIVAMLALAPGERVVSRNQIGTGEVRIEQVERVDGERLRLVGRGEVAVTDVATLDQAIDVLSKAIEKDARSARLYLDRALLWRAKRNWKEAHADLYKALPLNASATPLNTRLEYRILRTLTAIYAASPDKESRSGFKAVEWGLAIVGLKEGATAESYDTLAAAFAESGQFKEAIQCERSAIKLQPDGAGYMDRMKLYQAGKPFRDETGTW